MNKQEAGEVIDMLENAPLIIKLAKEMIAYLPKSATRDELVKNLLSVKHALIDLDVCLQDIEWSINQYQVIENMKEDK